VFVEDAVVVFGDLGPLPRRRRVAARRGLRGAVAATGLETAEIVAPGTLDGGDVLKIGSTVYVGASSRTNADGSRTDGAAGAAGWQVVAGPVERVLHQERRDGAARRDRGRLRAPGRRPGRLRDVRSRARGARYGCRRPRPRRGADVLRRPETAARYEARGLRVVATPITEFEKLEGCVTCLSVRIRD
jgi:dimethylargininase